MKKREYQYDLLRVISMIAVIIIHVSGIWVSGFSSFIHEEGALSELLHPLAACIYDAVSRFAVPCFVMLSGAFLLADERNIDYIYFYKKSFYKVGIPGIIFTVLYTVYRVMLCFVGEQQGLQELTLVVSDVVRGVPLVHMWYLYMLIGLYMLVPVILLFKNSILENTFYKVSVVFLILACISCWTTENVRINWSIGLSFEYVGYLLIGYVLKTNKEKIRHPFLLIILGIIIEICTAFVNYYFRIVHGMQASDFSYQIVSPYSPSIVVSSILIFAGFSAIRIPKLKLLEKLSECSYIIYLVHMGVIDIISRLLPRLLGLQYYLNLSCVIWIPILTIVTLLISYLLTLIYNIVYTKLHSILFT